MQTSQWVDLAFDVRCVRAVMRNGLVSTLSDGIRSDARRECPRLGGFGRVSRYADADWSQGARDLSDMTTLHICQN